MIIFRCIAFFLFLFGGFGITGGAHRLWAHRCYKAKWPLRLFAAAAQTLAVQVGTRQQYLHSRGFIFFFFILLK